VEGKESTIMRAVPTLQNSISVTQETMSQFENVLASVIANPETALDKTACEKEPPAQTSLEEQLRGMNTNIRSINEYLRSMQNRVQL
ncbi:hypothetical protein KAR91_07905, partial [Candidatus Pacearchaeota archaeon]|nr:hypothetical protein [Candidatus Pacearchaeota archaeon]